MKNPTAVIIAAGGPNPDESDAGKVIFAAPDGLDLEDKKPGDSIEFVAECEIEDGGKLCLKKLNGIEVGGNDSTPEKEPPKDFTDAVTGPEQE